MDRDMVNCLHHLYYGEITRAQLLERQPPKRLFWCDKDTRYPLCGSGIVLEDPDGTLTLAPNVGQFIDMVEEQLRSMPKPDYAFGYPISAAIRTPGEKRPAFLAIPYEPAFDPVKRTVKDAAKLADFSCEVTGDLSTAGHIMDQVWQGIRSADAVVADITGKNANVFYEIGLAQALGKEVILISQEAHAPFDVQAQRRVPYDPGDLPDLGRRLVASFKSIPARYPFEGPEPRY